MLVRRVSTDHRVGDAYNSSSRGNIDSLTGARAELVAKADDCVGHANIAAGLDRAVMDAPAESVVAADASNILRLAAKLGSLSKHVLAADFLLSRLVSKRGHARSKDREEG